MKTTTFEEFEELAAQGTFVPVCKEIMADLLTPVSAFLKIAEHSDYAFLLESVEGGEHVGRYSFLGKDPFLVLRADLDGRTTIDRAGVTTVSDEPFIPTLRRLMADFRAPVVPDLPRFTGGAVGFLGYDATSWFEPVPREAAGRRRGRAIRPPGFMLFDTVLAFDHVRHRILIIANARVTPGRGPRGAVPVRVRQDRVPRARAAGEPVAAGAAARRAAAGAVEHHPRAVRVGGAQRARSTSRPATSTRWCCRSASRPTSTPTRSRSTARCGTSTRRPTCSSSAWARRSIVGASPEMLVRVEGDRVETHPIAGTRPRGRDEAEDLRLAEELKANEKERAEHVMLVDLGRNDVGRVSEYGSVRVPQFMGLERYSHVMHLVSVVEGRLARDCDRLDALVSCFPAGTVSGAPKIRAMEIIAALEPDPRGIYAGAVGYLDFAGNLDFCIAIRTIVMAGRRRGCRRAPAS